MRIFKSTWFDRFANKVGITDEELREIVNLLESGQADVDYGAGVYKMRIARPGEGKSGGHRVIVLFRSKERTFFVYGFPKSAKANISKRELRMAKETAKEYFSLTTEQLEKRIKRGRFIELQEHDK